MPSKKGKSKVWNEGGNGLSEPRQVKECPCIKQSWCRFQRPSRVKRHCPHVVPQSRVCTRCLWDEECFCSWQGLEYGVRAPGRPTGSCGDQEQKLAHAGEGRPYCGCWLRVSQNLCKEFDFSKGLLPLFPFLPVFFSPPLISWYRCNCTIGLGAFSVCDNLLAGQESRSRAAS